MVKTVNSEFKKN